MKKNPGTGSLDSQRQLLAQWLKEWEIDRALRTVPLDDGSRQESARSRWMQMSSGKTVCDSAVPVPKVGDIRLLPPTVPGGNERPIYIALLESTSSGFLVAPFGRFSIPASPGEWLTGLNAVPLRVLCLWNSCVVTEQALRMCWFSGRLAAGRLRQALDIYRREREFNRLCVDSSSRGRGGTRPSTCASGSDDWRAGFHAGHANVGPPILHPLDPRLVYQAEESELLEESVSSLQARLEASTAKSETGPTIYDIGDTGLRRAAESRGSYGKKPKGRGRRGGKKNGT